MTVIEGLQEAHDARFRRVDGRRVVDHYGRPARTHVAVRNVVGVIEMGYGVVRVTGEDRVEFVDNAVSNRVPAADGEGVYALLLDPGGTIETDMYVYTAEDHLLVFTPPERAEPLAADWAEKTFIQDVAFDVATEEFAVFGVHGPKATEKVASVLAGAATPEAPLSFVRGGIEDAGVTVVRTDGLAGEEGYEVICGAADAASVFESLETRGLNATPFGYRTWESLTLEAGTPLYGTELADRLPNAVGVRNAVDLEKGCFVGQEVVSRIANRGQPPERLVGVTLESTPAAGDPVLVDDETVGTVTRAIESPSREEPVAFAFVEYDLPEGPLSVRTDEGSVAAERTALPFVEGSDASARVPTYPE